MTDRVDPEMDIVEMLRAMAQGEARSGVGMQRWKLFRAAADEIERLREVPVMKHKDIRA